MNEHQNLPDINRLSIIAATILLIYCLAPFIEIPGVDWEVRFPWAVFYLRFDMATIISILIALITTAGTDWLLRSHPRIGEQNLIQHLILPTLTAWVIGIPLYRIPINMQWWAVFAFGGILLIMVLISEYIAVDLTDSNYALATMGLSAVSYALFLFLTISLRGSGLRLYLVLPGIAVAAFLMSLRTLYLRLAGKWCLNWSIAIMMVVSQIIIGLHYLPVSPLAYGLILLGPTYALINLAGSYEEGRLWDAIWAEPVIVLLLIWVLVLLLGV